MIIWAIREGKGILRKREQMLPLQKSIKSAP